jgi:hypothetical protein
MSEPGAGRITSALHLALPRCVGKPVVADYIVLRQITSTFLTTKMFILSQNAAILTRNSPQDLAPASTKTKNEEKQRTSSEFDHIVMTEQGFFV